MQGQVTSVSVETLLRRIHGGGRIECPLNAERRPRWVGGRQRAEFTA